MTTKKLTPFRDCVLTAVKELWNLDKKPVAIGEVLLLVRKGMQEPDISIRSVSRAMGWLFAIGWVERIDSACDCCPRWKPSDIE